MLEAIVRAVCEGSVVLTANQRLSRTLRKAYDDGQCSQGRRAWLSPSILPLSSWLRARWPDAMLAGVVPATMLLSSAQEEFLWRRTIAGSPHAAGLLDLRGTAQSAMQAWRLIHQYRLRLDAQFSAHEDWAAFHAWALEYRQACDRSNWLDEARLPDAVLSAVGDGGIHLPAGVLLAGFDEFTPQQRHLLEALERAGCPSRILEPEALDSAVVRRSCRDADDELRSAAEWARDLLRANSRHSIGVVLLDLGVRRTRLERIFDEVLHPESMRDPVSGARRAFHISIPDPLSNFPLVGAALLALNMAAGNRWKLADLGLLLRSQFVAGGVEEAGVRAMLDARLRRWRRVHVAVSSVVAVASECPALSGILQRWSALTSAFTGIRLPSAWGPLFREVLGAAGWPGDRVLSSGEYQVSESWNGLLREFSSLDAIAGPVSYYDALARLRELAGETQFQPQDPGAPVQIVGALEAAGARFDALWICGATDQTWPAPAHPHPFLPLIVQTEHRLPHSTPEREHEFAVRIFTRLRSSAPELIVSWPRRAGDVELRPSPLIEAVREQAEYQIPAEIAAQPLALEQIVDELGPALETVRPRGGTQVLKLQSACPFQAFADLRLAARPLEAGQLGLSAADRGSAIHDALRYFWESVRDHATLSSMSTAELRRTAEAAVAGAVRKAFRDSQHAFDRRFRELEAQRLTDVLVEWASLEKQRAAFRVAFSERERTIPVGGLELAGRIDRVDDLPGGGQVIIDYKATAPSLAAWFGERPDEPQLPLYAISNDAPVAAVAFAQVGPEGLKFKGYSISAGILPGTRLFDDSGVDPIGEWRRVLGPIAESFRNGLAAADPKNGRATCDLCRRMSLCRIHEIVVQDVEVPDAQA